MRFGGRIAASIEVLDDVFKHHTPAADALRDWGKKHRFAGSKDRAAIGGMVHDGLRRRSSIAWRMDSDSSRALVLGVLVFVWGETVEAIEICFDEDDHAPDQLSDDEKKNLKGRIELDDAPDWIRADVPEWIWPSFENNFVEEAVNEGQALMARPPLDLRTNTIKSDQESVLKSLSGFEVSACELSPNGIRITQGEGLARLPNIQAEPAYLTGDVEIQDEGSQIVSLLVDAQPGEKVLDYCAGGGGKTLAMAADMQNKGEVFAYDIDKRRLAPIYTRAMKAGVNILTVCQPNTNELKPLIGKMDRVLVDAPCTGSGTWRRKPDAKWRLSLDTLELRQKEQQTVLKEAKQYVRSGGLLFYVTCSMFAEENEAQVYRFLDENDNFELLSAGEVWEDKIGVEKSKPWSEDGLTVTLTPGSTNTDGFFFAVLRQK